MHERSLIRPLNVMARAKYGLILNASGSEYKNIADGLVKTQNYGRLDRSTSQPDIHSNYLSHQILQSLDQLGNEEDLNRITHDISATEIKSRPTKSHYAFIFINMFTIMEKLKYNEPPFDTDTGIEMKIQLQINKRVDVIQVKVKFDIVVYVARTLLIFIFLGVLRNSKREDFIVTT